MVMTKKANRKVALDHIVLNLLDQDPQGELVDVLLQNGITSPANLCNLSLEDIGQLWHTDATGKDTPLMKGRSNLLRILKYFKASHATAGNPIQDDGWTTITPEEFTEFRFSDECEQRIEGLSQMTTSASGSAQRRNAANYSNLTEFRKGVKRDPALFPKLQDPRHWDSWHRDAKAQALAQMVYEIFDPTYKPPVSDKDLFEEKKKYMYAIFERTLLHDKGKSLLVRKHEATYDAHKLYEELLQYHTLSTLASLESGETLA